MPLFHWGQPHQTHSGPTWPLVRLKQTRPKVSRFARGHGQGFFLLCLSLMPPQHTKKSRGHYQADHLYSFLCLPLSLCCVKVHVGSCHSECVVRRQTPARLQHRNTAPHQRKDSLQKSLGLVLFMLQHSNEWSS